MQQKTRHNEEWRRALELMMLEGRWGGNAGKGCETTGLWITGSDQQAGEVDDEQGGGDQDKLGEEGAEEAADHLPDDDITDFGNRAAAPQRLVGDEMAVMAVMVVMAMMAVLRGGSRLLRIAVQEG
jgi:hypothetical protein